MTPRLGKRRLLVVSAFAPELAWLRRALRQAVARGEGPAAQVICQSVGIGAVDAAHGTARAIATTAPDLVLFLGTAGTYAPPLAIGDVAIARDLVLISTASVRGDGYLPGRLPVVAATDARMRAALGRAATASGVSARLARVGTTLAITRGRALATRLRQATQADAENLEAFAVARAAALARVAFGAVLGIANRVGPRAHAEWTTHAGPSAAAAGRVVLAFALARAPTRPARPR